MLGELESPALFLDSVPLLKNLADPSGATDAKQFTATNQPTALPLIDGDGYLYLSGVSANSAEIPDSVDFTFTTELDVRVKCTTTDWTPAANQIIIGKATGFNATGLSFYLQLSTDGKLTMVWNDGSVQRFNSSSVPTGLVDGSTKWVRGVLETDTGSGYRLRFYLSDDGVTWTQLGSDVTGGATGPIYDSSAKLTIGQGDNNFGGAFSGAVSFVGVYASTDGTNKVLDVDFTAPNVRHGDTAFECATGQVVTINQSGNNPATVIKKPVLRFDGVDDGLDGLFASSVDSGYMFAAFSVLGDGGENYARVFATNESGQTDVVASSWIWSLRNATSTGIGYYNNGSFYNTHTNMYDDARGDYLHEHKVISGSQKSAINNADLKTTGNITSLVLDEFHIGVSEITGDNNAALDLEYLALFPATLTDEQADAVRNYINNRNNVFDLKDGFGYYFFDPQSLSSGAVTSWNGRIIGSDNGDVDKLATQATAADQPTSDGYVVTFADATDHLDIPSTTQAGWQVVGTSLGTFAYKVNANAVTELTMLGNAGTYRAFGDLYGIMLLPESATNRDIEEARKLLIDRGASESVTGSSAESFWISRSDIVEFSSVDFSGVTNVRFGWNSCSAMTKFNVGSLPDATNVYNAFRSSGLTSFNTDLPLATRVDFAWYQCASLSSFTTTDIKNCTNFISAWQNCASLTQFPQDAKLGTEASNVNFRSAWQSSGLTSLPALDLSKGVNFLAAFLSSDISSIDPNVLLGTAASSATVDFANIFNDCQNLTEVPVGLNLSKGNRFQQAFRYCSSLVDFAPNIFDSIGTPLNYCFNNTWQGTSALNATSVENILVSIATSAQSAPSIGPEITIDYNVSTGSLTAATLTAIETLNGRGWSVNINNEIIVPNILQLQPAAAYSLRSFDSDADPTVVNVRRSSDGALSDFKASEVSDGTLTDWVNTEYEIFSPTSNDGGFEDGIPNSWIFQANSSLDSTVSRSGTKSAKINVVGGAFAYFDKGSSPLQVGNRYTLSFWAKGSDITKQFRVYLGTQSFVQSFTEADTWEYFEITHTVGGSTALSFQRHTNSGDYTIHIDDITLTQLTADGHVTTWYDQGGTNHATQSTASNQPKIVDGGVLVTGGLNFDGVDDYFSTSLSIAAPINSFCVGSMRAVSQSANFFDAGSGSRALHSWRPDVSPDAWRLQSVSTPAGLIDYTNDGTFVNNVEFVTSALINGASSYLAKDGAVVVTGDAGSTTIDNILIGIDRSITSTYAWKGTFNEMIFFNTDQSSNRTGIENNINDHFNIYS